MILPHELSDMIARYDQAGYDVVSDFAKEVDLSTPPPALYHYTNRDGLLGMLKSGKFWLTDIFYLNDPSELKHGFSFALEELEKLTKGLLCDIEEFVRAFVLFHNDGMIEESAHFFVCCFSSCGDDLGQWRAYADNGCGFALEFETKELEQAFIKPIVMPVGNAVTPQTFPVTYDDKRLRDIQATLANLVLGSIVLPASVHPWGKKEFWRQLSIRHAVNSMAAVIFFKHEAYRNEREYRFLQMFSVDQAVPDIQYRTRSSALIKYREFNWRTNAGTSLKRIVIGPGANKDDAKRFVRDCLLAYEPRAADIEIIQSQIPYRAR
jgi:hypothetical protein